MVKCVVHHYSAISSEQHVATVEKLCLLSKHCENHIQIDEIIIFQVVRLSLATISHSSAACNLSYALNRDDTQTFFMNLLLMKKEKDDAADMMNLNYHLLPCSA